MIEHLLFFRALDLCVKVTDSSYDCQTNWRRDEDMTRAEDVKWGGERVKPICHVLQKCLSLFVTSSTY